MTVTTYEQLTAALYPLAMAAQVQANHWEHRRQDVTLTLDEAQVATDARDRWQKLANDAFTALDVARGVKTTRS